MGRHGAHTTQQAGLSPLSPRSLLNAVRATIGWLGVRSPATREFVKRVKATRLKLISARSNARFVATYPAEPMPPLDILVDAHASASYERYWNTGAETARFLFDIFMKHLDRNGASPVRVLEWGCGSGRTLRHLRRLYAPGTVSLHGTDYNHASVQWCRDAYPDIAFSANDLAPPLPLNDGSVDIAYAVSVLTHLPDDMCRAWIAELTRVVRPGGLILFTTGGWPFRTRYQPNEQAAYLRGEPIYRGWDDAGRRDFFSWHPPEYVRRVFLAGLQELEYFPAGAQHDLQDFWLTRRVESADIDLTRRRGVIGEEP